MNHACFTRSFIAFLLQLHDVRNFIEKRDERAAFFGSRNRTAGLEQGRPDDDPVLAEDRVPLNVAKDPVGPEVLNAVAVVVVRIVSGVAGVVRAGAVVKVRLLGYWPNCSVGRNHFEWPKNEHYW